MILIKNSSLYAKVTMHIFCYASQSAFAASAFIRTEFVNNISCELVQARNRVSLIKKMTITRLELLLCTIGTILIKVVKEDLEFDKSIPVYYWSNSSNAFNYIKKNENWGVYVFNRIKEIRKLTNSTDRRRISGFLNPADFPSRGCNIENLSRSRWWEGPEWLKLPFTDLLQSDINPDRVKETSGFEVVGVDLCDPLYLKGSQKSWVVIFTCAIYRAVPIGLATSLSTDCFILALRRFIARRDGPFLIYSDNGITLVVRKASSIKEGDIVLVGDPNSKNINWSLGKVKKIYPGKDGIVHVFEIKTKIGSFLTPIQRLYPLEVGEPGNFPFPGKEPTPLISDGHSTRETPSVPDPVSTKTNRQDPLVRRSRYCRILKYTKT
ncbi:uncharacterized protein TNCV_2185421 [Trichonephila clavipes]|nr:uncharacterized protein TNCV_2185421 [Trichonephila clavipes]